MKSLLRPAVLRRPVAVNWLDPSTWDFVAYMVVGLVLTVVMLVAGYGIGLAWQRWRDKGKTKS